MSNGSATEVAGLKIEIDFQEVLSELKRIGSATDDAGKDMVAALGRRVKQAETAVKKAAKDAEKAQGSIDRFGDASGKVGANVGKMAGALEMAGGPLANHARGLADIADLGEVAAESAKALGVSLRTVLAVALPLALAIGAGSIAYDRYAASIEKAAQKLKDEQEATKDTLAIQRQVVDATLKLSNLKGDISDKEYAQLSAAQTADELFAAKKQGLIEKINAEAAAVEASNRSIALHKARIDDAADAAANLGRHSGGLAGKVASSKVAITEATKANEASAATMTRLSGELGRLVRDEGAYTAVLVETDRVQARLNDKAETWEEMLGRIEAGLAPVLAQHARYRATLEQIRDIGDAAETSRLTGIQKVIAARDQELAQLDKLKASGLADAGGNGDRRLQVELDYGRAKVEIERKAQIEIDKVRDEAAKREGERLAKVRDQQIAQVNQVGGYVTQGLGVIAAAHDQAYQSAADGVARLEAQMAASEAFLTDAQKQALEKRIEAQKDAAEKQFIAARNAKAAEAMASTALAAINAIAQSPPPSPFGLIGAGVATAAGVLAVSQIESQQFTAYTGGLTPDEVPSMLHTEEAVMSRQGRAAMGDDAINRANAGMSAAPSSYRLQVRFNNKVLDEPIASTIQEGGELEREISGRTRSGATGHGKR